jgi:NADH:ubiquinone oxidoreductase subunit D
MTIRWDQHPSTHGVLRLDRCSTAMVVKATPDIGYLHTGMEKLFGMQYQQGIVITGWIPEPAREQSGLCDGGREIAPAGNS